MRTTLSENKKIWILPSSLFMGFSNSHNKYILFISYSIELLTFLVQPVRVLCDAEIQLHIQLTRISVTKWWLFIYGYRFLQKKKEFISFVHKSEKMGQPHVLLCNMFAWIANNNNFFFKLYSLLSNPVSFCSTIFAVLQSKLLRVDFLAGRHLERFWATRIGKSPLPFVT
jgi:hypothetical protein